MIKFTDRIETGESRRAMPRERFDLGASESNNKPNREQSWNEQRRHVNSGQEDKQNAR